MTSIPAGKGSDFALTLAMTQCLVGSAASQSPPPASVRPYLCVFKVTCATGGLRTPQSFVHLLRARFAHIVCRFVWNLFHYLSKTPYIIRVRKLFIGSGRLFF